MYHQQRVSRLILIVGQVVNGNEKKEVDLKLNLGERLPKLVSTMTFVHLKQLFGVYLKDSFQEDCKVHLIYPWT